MNESELKRIWKRSLNYTNSYDEEWCQLFGLNYFCKENLRSLALIGELRNCRFRSICWRLYLGILSDRNENWKQEISKSREIYENLRKEYIIDPREASVIRDDPLSLHDASQWNKFFKSQDMIKEISQDVVRAFPEIEYFQSTAVRNSMINILYCYSQTSELRYRQGMHEILAPLIFVLHCDHMTYEHSCELSILSQSTKIITDVLLDSSFLEHDAYYMFMQLMTVIEPWYDTVFADLGPITSRRSFSMGQKTVLADPRPFSCQKYIVPDCSIGQRLSYIHNNILKRLDLDLYLHLERLNILPQMFGLRWLRLLFGREYTLQDLLYIWDVVFATGGLKFPLVNHIYVSMLVHIRELLLANDFAACLTQLMHYPTNVDVNHIINLALHLFNPDLYDKPDDQVNHYHGCVPLSSLATTLVATNNDNHLKRVQRNKTFSGIENIANKFSNFLNKRQSVIPSTLATIVDQTGISVPQKLISQERAVQTLATEYNTATLYNYNDLRRVCVEMLDESIAAIHSQELDRAQITLKHTRDILSGNLTLSSVSLESQNLDTTKEDISCSASDNDVSVPITNETPATNGLLSPRHRERLASSPSSTTSIKMIELQNVSMNNDTGLWEQVSANYSLS